MDGQAQGLGRAQHHLNYECHHDHNKKQSAEHYKEGREYYKEVRYFEYYKEVRYFVHVQRLPESEEYSVNDVANA